MTDHRYRRLRVRPWTVKRADALAFVASTHRRRKKIQGAMWCVSARLDNEIVGVALVGWPARKHSSDDLDTLCVLRVAVKPDPDDSTKGIKNVCSMLYGACWKAARAMGAESMVTFTDLDEPGTSLIAAGWIEDGITSGGEWDRPSRKRGPAVNAEPKRRWWAPGSARAPKKQEEAAPCRG